MFTYYNRCLWQMYGFPYQYFLFYRWSNWGSKILSNLLSIHGTYITDLQTTVICRKGKLHLVCISPWVSACPSYFGILRLHWQTLGTSDLIISSECKVLCPASTITERISALKGWSRSWKQPECKKGLVMPSFGNRKRTRKGIVEVMHLHHLGISLMQGKFIYIAIFLTILYCCNRAKQPWCRIGPGLRSEIHYMQSWLSHLNSPICIMVILILNCSQGLG